MNIDRAAILRRLDKARDKRNMGLLEFLRVTGLSDTTYYRFRDAKPSRAEVVARQLSDCADRLERGEALPRLRTPRKNNRKPSTAVDNPGNRV